jgi:signal peptidase I
MSRRLLTILSNSIFVIVFVPLSWISYIEISKLLGLRAEVVEVVGTGSMYPSLYWDEESGGPEKSTTDGVLEYRSSPRMYRYFPGLQIFGQTYLKPKLGYGDMVAFSSSKTREILESEGKNPQLGFIKRIIGLPGDEIELRDGYVLLNGQNLAEPYIRTARSTYGGSTLAECTKVTVPPGSYFVLGDNRKVSSDSRYALGYVLDQEIMYYLPFASQTIYHSLWRDPALDGNLSGTATLKPSDFYQKTPNLKPNSKLESSSTARAQALLANPETTYDLATALSRFNYTNIVSGEFVTYGHYTADELWENLQANYETKKQLTNPDYDDIGLSAVLGNLNGCPTQVVVGHLGGYVPATYSQEMLDSWQGAKANLAEVIPSWEVAIGVAGVDQEKLQELLKLLREKQTLVDDVLRVINSREWMSPELKARLSQDEANSQRIEQLSKELNQE